MSGWFEVDKAGLAKLMAGRPKGFILFELLQNAWDQDVRKVTVTTRRSQVSKRTVCIEVEDDDPNGFADLADAYTLFAESRKKTDANKRGRFNMGEKLVLALSEAATISTTTGTVVFSKQGRVTSRAHRESGSLFTAHVVMTKAEEEEMLLSVYKLLPPVGVETIVNNVRLSCRQATTEFQAALPTLIANEEGVLTRTIRNTTVSVYEAVPGEVPSLYEMGIPVVETGDKYHVNIGQKVPLNMERDNVTPAYLQAIRVAVLNQTAGFLTESEATETWVKEACSDDRADTKVISSILKLRFGDNAVAYDPSDPEANKRAVSEGRKLVYGNSLSANEWRQVKRAEAIKPAGQVTPSNKPFAEYGEPMNIIPQESWTESMQLVVEHSKVIASQLLNCEITVKITNDFGANYMAAYGPGNLVFNLSRLGHAFFSKLKSDELHDLLIHEFGHHYSGDHLSREYYDALTSLGAKLTRLALQNPKVFA